MNALRHLLAVSALFWVLGTHAVAGPDDDKRPTENGGIWVYAIDDGSSFESHAAVRSALDSRKIELLGDAKALEARLARRGASQGAIVIVDGAALFANPSEAYQQALALVAKYKGNVTYVFVNEPSDRVQPSADTQFKANGPVNASGLVEAAIQESIKNKVITASEVPECITLVTKSRADRVLKNEALGKTATPSDLIPWPRGHKIAVLASAPFEREGSSPTVLTSALIKAVNGSKVARVAYEVLGGESTVVGTRMLALASEFRVAVTREMPFEIHVYYRGDDTRSAATKLGETKDAWLARLKGSDDLPPSLNKSLVQFSAETHNLYDKPLALDGEREVTVSYSTPRRLGIFGGGTRVAKFTLRYEGGRVYIESNADYPITLRNNKGDGIGRVVSKGISELPMLEGPVAEVQIEVGNQRTSVMLVDPRHRVEVVGALFPRDPPDFAALAGTYARTANEGGIPVAPATSGGAAVAAAPADAAPVRRIADPSVFDPLKQYFPPLNEQIRKAKLPYALPTEEALKAFERSTLVAKKGIIVFVVPDGVSTQETLNRLLYEVTVNGSVRGIPRNQHFAELRTSLVASKWVNETENRLEIINGVAQKEHVYLVNYNLTSLTDFGRHSESSTNALGTLGPSMENDRVTLITATTASGLEAFLKRNPNFRPFVGQVRLPEVTESYAHKVMDAYSDREKRPRIPDAMKKDFIELSNRFSARGGQPERVIDFMSNYYPITDDLGMKEVTTESLRAAAKTHYGLTDEDFDPKLKADRLNRVRQTLNDEIIGMEHVKEAFIEYLDHERREFYRGRRYPSFLLTGPPGLAKTYIVRKLAVGIVGDRFHEINMGGPAGQSIQVLYRAIADAVSKNADAVIFLDEIEKASLAVQEALLKPMYDRVLDYQPNEGSSELERISLKSVRFFAASNAGTDYLQQCYEMYDPTEHEKAKAAGKETEYLATIFQEEPFRDSLKNRIIDSLLSRFEHRVYPIFPLTKENFEKLVALKIAMLTKEFSQDRYVGPLQVVDAPAFARRMTEEMWSRKVDIRNVEGRIRDAFLKAVGRAQDAAGRQPGVEVGTSCEKLLVELVTPAAK